MAKKYVYEGPPIRRQVGKRWVVLGVTSDVTINRPPPKKKVTFKVATQDDLKELSRIWNDIVEVEDDTKESNKEEVKTDKKDAESKKSNTEANNGPKASKGKD